MADNKEDSASDSTNESNTKTEESLETTPTNEEIPQSLEPVLSEANASSNIETPPPSATDKEIKIAVLLKATGDAPIMSKKKWVVSHDKTIGWISGFIKKCLKLGAEERLFLYINQTFAPAPDQTVKNLYDCYGTDGKLIIHYCKSLAWG